MLRIKRCPECRNNVFHILVDSQAFLVCSGCKLRIPVTALKHLPDDKEATASLTVAIQQSKTVAISQQPKVIAIEHKE